MQTTRLKIYIWVVLMRLQVSHQIGKEAASTCREQLFYNGTAKSPAAASKYHEQSFYNGTVKTPAET